MKRMAHSRFLLAPLAEQASTPQRRVSPMQVAAQFLEDVVGPPE